MNVFGKLVAWVFWLYADSTEYSDYGKGKDAITQKILFGVKKKYSLVYGKTRCFVHFNQHARVIELRNYFIQ